MKKMPMVKKSRNAVSSDPESKVKVGLSLTPYSADRLNIIARKLDISRSELLERLAKGALEISTDKTEVSVTWKKGQDTAVEVADSIGEIAQKSEINHAKTAQTDSENQSPQPNPLQASYESLLAQLLERESSIAGLQQQLASLPNLEGKLHETVAKSSYETLQQQLTEHESSIASLHSQLTEKQNLEQEVHQKLSEKRSSIKSLRSQLAELQQSLESQLQQSVSKSSYESLLSQLAEKSSSINHFQYQLTKLQDLENQLSQSVAKQRNYDTLQQQSQEQLRTIKALREQLAQQQAVAGIGEAYLNKWRRS